MKTHKWEVLNKSRGSVENDKIVEILLENRGIKTKKEKEEFLNPRLEDITFETVQVDRDAVRRSIKRIEKAVKNNEKVVIYGDYDVDGICGTAILWETLYGFYKNVIPYIPHRVDEGYGLSTKGIEDILSTNPDVKLIITVDNGIVANDAVDYANKKKIDVIVTDHHVAGEKAPDAFSIVHTIKLCGTGVAYLLSQEIVKNHESRSMNNGKDEHLGLVALATVADLVPLVGANRTFVKFGINALHTTKRPGLLALLADAAIRKEDISTYEIGHIIAPRLNAAGRITHAMDSLRLVCTKDAVRAKKLAANLSQTNRDRQFLTEESTVHANLITEVTENIIFVASPEYNPGVIGLIASRLVEKHYRPAFVLSIGGEVAKGSARSVAGFNIIEFIRLFDEFLIDAGGHPMAAGFTIKTERIEEFKKVLVAGSKRSISEEILTRVLKIDCELSFNEISNSLFESIQKLKPFGMANSEPVFLSKNVRIESTRFVGRDSKHLKLQLSQNGKTFDAILFSLENYPKIKQGDKIDLVYNLNQDSWSGTNRIQLKLRDIHLS